MYLYIELVTTRTYMYRNMIFTGIWIRKWQNDEGYWGKMMWLLQYCVSTLLIDAEIALTFCQWCVDDYRRIWLYRKHYPFAVLWFPLLATVYFTMQVKSSWMDIKQQTSRICDLNTWIDPDKYTLITWSHAARFVLKRN